MSHEALGKSGEAAASLPAVPPLPPPRTRPGRGRRPSEQVREDILESAAQLLLSEGVGGFTVERIAALAGVSKVSVYKWWPSRGVLAIEAHARTVDSVLALPDTGNIEADIASNLEKFVDLLTQTRAGRVTAELLGAAQTDPMLADAFRRIYLKPRRAAGVAAFTIAKQRRQIREDTDVEVLSDQLWGACMYRLMTGLQPFNADFVQILVRNVFAGIRIARPS